MNALQTLLALVGLIYVLCVIVQALQEVLKSALNTKADVMAQTINQFMGEHLPLDKVRDALKVRGLDLTALEHFNKDDFRELLNGVELLAPQVQGVIAQGQATVDQVKDNMAAAYNGALARFQALYAKKNKLFAAAFSLIVVLLLNANVIMLYQELAADQVMAQAIAVKAGNVVAQSSDSNIANLKDTYDKSRKDVGNLMAEFPPIVRSGHYKEDFSDRPVSAIVGLLLMAALVSLGAPFWNDVLKGLTGINNTLNSAKKGAQ